MLIIIAGDLTVPPPHRYPHIYIVLNVILGCGVFLCCLLLIMRAQLKEKITNIKKKKLN